MFHSRKPSSHAKVGLWNRVVSRCGPSMAILPWSGFHTVVCIAHTAVWFSECALLILIWFFLGFSYRYGTKDNHACPEMFLLGWGTIPTTNNTTSSTSTSRQCRCLRHPTHETLPIYLCFYFCFLYFVFLIITLKKVSSFESIFMFCYVCCEFVLQFPYLYVLIHILYFCWASLNHYVSM